MALAYINQSETLLQLFPGAVMGRLTNGIFSAVDRSFRDPNGKLRRDITHIEIKDRFEACIKQARMLRGDLKWGVERIIGALDEVLNCHLAKMDFVPDKRQVWFPKDGAI